MIRRALIGLLQKLFPDENIVVDRVPKDKPGDYATNIAFKIAAQQKKPPQQVAEEIAAGINDPMIEDITVQPPAFINFTINRKYLLESMFYPTETLNIGNDEKVLVEFVSANPTGPLNIVSARAAAVGDSLVRLLNHTGFQAHAEYYINDGGKQTGLLADSVQQRIKELHGGTAEIPEDGYKGSYIIDVARAAEVQSIEEYEELREFSIKYFIAQHKATLDRFGVSFDHWTRESAIYKTGLVETVLGMLKKKGLTYEQESAMWLKTTLFGDKDDRVIITSDNRHTYLLPDIGYHFDKIQRGYTKLIDILGPDHQAQVKSMQSSIQALGQPGDILKVIIVQQVNLKKGGEILKMSKRAGILETMDELLDQIPRDVVRFFLLMRSNSQHLDFDIDLAQQQSDENPVYYVQYANARIHSILHRASEQNISLPDNFDVLLIKESEELDLVKALLKFDEVLEDAVHHLEPYMLTYYLLDVARIFHFFYQKHRVINDQDLPVTYARLALIKKAADMIKQGLSILGISCPEKM
jgi:arginyl-tRNA synthetase